MKNDSLVTAAIENLNAEIYRDPKRFATHTYITFAIFVPCVFLLTYLLIKYLS